MAARRDISHQAFNRGIARTVRGSLKRFVAIATITALGVTMLVSLRMACVDLRASADSFFDAQGLFDVRVQSTLGLTDDDVEALARLDGVESVEGGWSETVYTTVGSGSEKVDVKALSETGMNEPLVLEGHLPETADEIAVTRRFLDDSGLSIGDTVTFHSENDEADDASTDDEDEISIDDGSSTAVFERKEYVICASVLDPMDINAGEGTMSFRSSGGSQYSFFVLPDNVTTDVFTVVYLAVEGAAEPLCYSADYEQIVDAVRQSVEDARQEREEARGSAIRDEANETIDEKEAEALSELADAQAELDDAQAEIDDGYAELADGRAELERQERDALAELADAQAQIDDGYAQLTSAEGQLEESGRQVADGLAQLEEGEEEARQTIAEKRAELEAAIADGRQQLADSRAQIEGAAALLAQDPSMEAVWPADAWERLASATTVDEAQAAADEVNAALEPFVSSSTQTVDETLSQLTAQKEQLDATIAQLESQLEQLRELLGEGGSEAGADEGLPEDGVATSEQAASLDPGQIDPSQIEAQIAELEATLDQLTSQREQLEDAISQLEEKRAQLEQMLSLAPGLVQVLEGEQQLEASYAEGVAQIDAAEQEALAEIAANRETLLAAQSQVESGWAELRANRATLDDSAATLASERAKALRQIADGWAELDDGEQTLLEAARELEDGWATFETERDDALQAIADAREEVAGIEDPTWYVQDRSSISSYASVDSDASSIEAIGTVIPVVFLAVAILVSLTTMTRMVDEERGLIGVYKALGYSRGRILSKYVLYALAACLAGSVVGNVFGFIVLPLILFTIFSTMYALPEFSLGFEIAYAIGSFALFAVAVVGATVLTCRHDLRESPASLMRPKAPRAGSRILLERIGLVWGRLGFLNKVTARNIFRYKRRFLMTVVGIAGCVALLVTGFGIRDTVLSLSERQYGEGGVVGYDLMAVTSTDDLDSVVADLEQDAEVVDVQRVYIDSLTVSYGDSKESVTLMVVPDGCDVSGFARLFDDSGATLDLGDLGCVITKNAEQVMGFSLGDELGVQDSTLAEGTVKAEGIATSYLGNTLYMTESAYEDAFGKACELNGVLLHLEGSGDEQIAFSERLSRDDRLLSVTSTEKLVQDFSSAFTLINTVVYVVIVLAAALSFTVVFTLSNTNISERERELATIKVLGFKRPEVHRYINKETLLLTGMGVLLGMPTGYALARSLTWILRMPSLYFDVIVEPVTYVISAAFAIVFTLVVNLITNRSLDRIDMVGALKSAE